jgi:CRP-like cAMP-binding protein
MSPRLKVRAPVAKRAERAAPEFSQNDILSEMDSAELATLMEHAEEISFPIKRLLFEQGDTIESVYFPLTGMISLVIVLDDGPNIEAMTVGKEGFVGLPLLNDVSTARYRGVCQIEGRFIVLSAKIFMSLIDALPNLKRRLRRYSQFASDVVSQSAACNSVHSVEQRCARWLLISSDAIGSTEFNLTQEFLSQMLAVRRPGVNVAMGALARQQLVSQRYGKVTLLDVGGLKNASCECYATIRAKARELLN